MHETVLQQAAMPAPAARPGIDLAAGLAGGAVVLLVVLLLLVATLIRHYRSECHQLRARNTQLSLENDRWHEDFAAQTGELSALRRSAGRGYGYRSPPPHSHASHSSASHSHAEAS